MACELSICPFVVGGGTKVQALEDCSHGMPIIDSHGRGRGARGMELLDQIVPVLSRASRADARTVVALLCSPAKLPKMRDRIVEALVMSSRKRLFQLNASMRAFSKLEREPS